MRAVRTYRRSRPRRRTDSRAAALILLAGVVTILLVWQLARPISLFIIAAAIAAALAPPVAWLNRRMPRGLAVILVYLLILIALALVIWGIVPTVIEQVEAATEAIPELLNEAELLIEELGGRLPEISFFDIIAGPLSEVGGRVVGLPLALASSIFDLVMIFVLSIYMLLEAPRFARFFLSLFPPEKRERAEYVSSKMTHAMGGYVQGAGLTAVLIGVLTYFGMLLLGVDYPLVLALIAGILEVIPNIGPVLAAVPMVFFALLDSTSKALLVVLFVVVLQQLESNVITPNIMRTRVEMSPLLIILAVLAGAALGGLVGIIAAIPLVAALNVLVMELLVPHIRAWLARSPRGAPPPA